MAFVSPSIDDFKTYFIRDFPFGYDISKNVLDEDIQKAFDMSVCQIAESLFCDQAEYNIGYYLLTAHYLSMNLQASSQGISGSFEWNTSSKSVGSVSVSQSIPTGIANDPNFAWLTRTNYGSQYLMMIYPRLAGNIYTVTGATLA